MPARESVEDAVFDGLAQNPEHMTSEFWPFIQEEHAVIRQRYITGQRRLLTPRLVKNFPA